MLFAHFAIPLIIWWFRPRKMLPNFSQQIINSTWRTFIWFKALFNLSYTKFCICSKFFQTYCVELVPKKSGKSIKILDCVYTNFYMSIFLSKTVLLRSSWSPISTYQINASVCQYAVSVQTIVEESWCKESAATFSRNVVRVSIKNCEQKKTLAIDTSDKILLH